MDDRNKEELEEIPKSRYSSCNFYLSNSEFYKEKYNDVKSRLNKEIMKYCKDEAEKAAVKVDYPML